MALADIIRRISRDAELEASEAVTLAEEQAAALLAAARSEADAVTRQIQLEAERQADARSETVIAGARLAARDGAVSARRALVEGAVAEVVSRIEALPEPEYARFLGRLIAASVREGDSVALAVADAAVSAAVRSAVEEALPDVNVTWAEPTDTIARGAVIEGRRTRQMLTPAAYVEADRDELELVIARGLFGAEGA